MGEHGHRCGGFFGCGEEQGEGVVRQDLSEASFNGRVSDRLTHMDEIDAETLDHHLTARGRSRRELLKASAFMGMLAAVGPWFGKRADAATPAVDAATLAPGAGRMHVVESTAETTKLGVFDTTLAPILKIDSGDIVSYRNTWSHFLNHLEPGVSIEKLAAMRVSNPGHGPHSIVGPIWINDAEPGDVLEIRYLRFVPDTMGSRLQQSRRARNRIASRRLSARAGQVRRPRSIADDNGVSSRRYTYRSSRFKERSASHRPTDSILRCARA